MDVKIRNYNFTVHNDSSFWSIINSWEPCSFDILDKFLDKDSIFIDLGAWNGVLSIYASKIAKLVYSFEPDPVAYRNLCQNIISNDIKNIIYNHKGVSDEEGVQKLYIRSSGDSVSSLIDRQQEHYIANEIIEINTIKISKFLLDNNIIPTLIKMDIEGGEIFVIEEMKKYIREYKPMMYISFHSMWFPDKDENIKILTDILSETYNIYNVNLIKYSKELFINSLSHSEHAFIFIKK